MELILTAQQSKLIDEIAINKFGYNSLQLMEIASNNIYFHLIEVIKKHNTRNILILTGNGNNGGDGYATARHILNSVELMSIIDEVNIIHVGNIQKMTKDTVINYNILKNISNITPKIKIHEFNDIKLHQTDNNIIFNFNPDLLIECLVGVGVSGILKNETAEIINLVNVYRQKNKHVNVVAIDNPAGINVDTGEILMENDAKSAYLRADYTFTMFSKKLGMVLKSKKNEDLDLSSNDNKQNSKFENLYGEIKVCDIGISQEMIFEELNKGSKINGNQIYKQLNIFDFRKILPSRNDISSKFNFGKVGIFAGERNMTGAAVMAANAALTIGSGLVYLYTDKSNNWGSLKPEVIKNELDFQNFENLGFEEMGELANSIISKNNINTWLIGPGVGTNIHLQKFLVVFINLLIQNNKYIILDADAQRVFHQLQLNENNNINFILTPHIIEFYRLYYGSCSSEQTSAKQNEIEPDNLKDLKLNFLQYSQEFAKKYKINLHLKYFPSTTTNGLISYFNDNYNSALSKGGSGDVLSGIIAGLLTQKFSSNVINDKLVSNTNSELNFYQDEILKVISISSIIQSYLANKYTENYNKESMNASNVIELIKYLPK